MKRQDLILPTGLLVLTATLLLQHITTLPDIVYGLGIGIALGLELVGMYSISKKKKQNEKNK